MRDQYRVRPHIHARTLKPCWKLQVRSMFFFWKDYTSRNGIPVWYHKEYIDEICHHMNGRESAFIEHPPERPRRGRPDLRVVK